MWSWILDTKLLWFIFEKLLRWGDLRNLEFLSICCRARGQCNEELLSSLLWEKKNETAEVCGNTKRMLSWKREKYFQMYNCKHILSAASPKPFQIAKLRAWKASKYQFYMTDQSFEEKRTKSNMIDKNYFSLQLASILSPSSSSRSY